MSEKRTFSIEGHLLEAGLLTKLKEQVTRAGGVYEFIDFEVGKTPDQMSRGRLTVKIPEIDDLNELTDRLVGLGAVWQVTSDVELEEAPSDGVVPDTFYSTSNHVTEVRIDGGWTTVADQRMDAMIVLDGAVARCVKLRDIRKGDRVVVENHGIRVHPPASEREQSDFGFMNSDISSERRVEHIIDELVADIRSLKAEGKNVVLVSGPVVVHTGGVGALERLIAAGAFDAILAGNALAVHDIERALYGTSLGINTDNGEPVVEGHRNHMRAINAISRSGSIPAAVKDGTLTRGIMHQAVQCGVPFVLAGSLRDDGPLPDTVTDMNEAQGAYGKLLKGAGAVVILSTMLHGIATGNMIPSSVQTVCVDINPSVVTKLADRGSLQTAGIVTDVGLFVTMLADKYERAVAEGK
ncbi:MAG: TIGR00300 family protein [Acidobacteriota bacterium]|nr:TIGR00300 family protein [Acidobacteriota bacterium]MDH3783914.1 TIGR00300 family protein [Acidobacteriota bacterium]